jgi:hypothetical protein
MKNYLEIWSVLLDDAAFVELPVRNQAKLDSFPPHYVIRSYSDSFKRVNQ